MTDYKNNNEVQIYSGSIERHTLSYLFLFHYIDFRSACSTWVTIKNQSATLVPNKESILTPVDWIWYLNLQIYCNKFQNKNPSECVSYSIPTALKAITLPLSSRTFGMIDYTINQIYNMRIYIVINHYKFKLIW